MGWRGWTILVFGLVFLGVGALFYLQNSLRVTELSLNLGVVAFQLQQPMAVPLLLVIAFGSGLVFGLILAMIGGRPSSSPASRASGASGGAGGDLWT